MQLDSGSPPASTPSATFCLLNQSVLLPSGCSGQPESNDQSLPTWTAVRWDLFKVCFYEAVDSRQEEALKVTLSFYSWGRGKCPGFKRRGPWCIWTLGSDLTLSLPDLSKPRSDCQPIQIETRNLREIVSNAIWTDAPQCEQCEWVLTVCDVTLRDTRANTADHMRHNGVERQSRTQLSLDRGVNSLAHQCVGRY